MSNNACHNVRRACAQRRFPSGIREKEIRPRGRPTTTVRPLLKKVNDEDAVQSGSNVVIISVPGRK
ncbi:hypothetical protein DK749_08980 [Salmonella enterica subsp. salamae]|nr:hypothetical protein [Salmonella enterica subsp. salamae]ECE5742887.1 hypothetical protein [Salmonella enterica subsp. salamae]ECJ3936795.1 hypothetical protein [Salmonella enterica subsp. salamae]